MQDARCLKVKPRERAFKQFKSPVLSVLRTPACSSTYENEQTLPQSPLILVRPFATCLKSLKWRDRAWFDMPMCALIEVEAILNICCEMCVDKQH